MLKWIEDINQLSFYNLMQIYTETNLKDVEFNYPYLHGNEALFCVESSFYHFLNDVFFKTKGAKYAIWIQNNKWVSALRLEPFVDGMLISGLETHPDHRNCGYAKYLLNGVISQMNSGLKVYAHIDPNNLASIAVHTRCGFNKISSCSHMLNGNIDMNMDTYFLSCV